MPIPKTHPLANQVGRSVRRYQLVQLLGLGSFGAVYRASTLSTPVALKLSNVEKASKDESENLKTLQGLKGVPQWLWFGKDYDQYVLVMTMGYKNLDQLRSLKGDLEYSFTKPTIQKIMYQATNILEEIHGRGILHRDLKANNYMVTFPEGPNNKVSLIIIDFGLSIKFKDEDGLIDLPEEAYRMYRQVHATPNAMMKFEHEPLDDMLQLTYSAIAMTNNNMEDFKGPFRDRYAYKMQLILDPELYMPEKLYWLRRFFQAVGDQDDGLPVQYDDIREAINNSLRDSEASDDLHLTNDNGVMKLI